MISRHSIECNRPAVRFCEGGLMGNGGLGVVVCTRPDSVVLRFGHTGIWDIRLAEKNREKIGTFSEVFSRIKSIPNLAEDPWLPEFCKMARENYAKPYPRPMPCGSVLLGFDRRDAELLGHRLDISNGECCVRFLVNGEEQRLRIFVDQASDHVLLAMFDARGEMVKSPFNRVRILPDPLAAKTMPLYSSLVDEAEHILSYRQILPSREPDEYDPQAENPKDRAFRLSVRLNQPIRRDSRMDSHRMIEMGNLERAIVGEEVFLLNARLESGPATQVDASAGTPLPATAKSFEEKWRASCAVWGDYWNRSGVVLEDSVLESAWYRNLYFQACSMRAGQTCPGLWGNWSYRDIGTEWHGDYHFNYNVQQPFWSTFSSNHPELHLPYVHLIQQLLPMSQSWARDYYGLRGAFFPHSAYPVEMSINPYPLPTLGWEVCETPWAVQSLWWHYLYTRDRRFLENEAFVPIREAVLFLVDYLHRPEARGPQWGDDRYHIFPTVAPELYGLRQGFDKNYDCIVTLTLVRFVFDAFQEACRICNREAEYADLLGDVRGILEHFPEYPTAESRQGEVWVSVPSEDPEVVVNTPNPLAPVFPGDEYGLHSCKEDLERARATLENLQIEGGNELVFLNLQAARLGRLDLEKFKRQLRYCEMPNGTFSDMVLQTKGRYADSDDYAFMSPMGIWVENFALPVVINECLMQSYNGIIRLFPNWPLDRRAEFKTLRAVGAFLVSGLLEDGRVRWVEIESEAGGVLRMYNPWTTAAVYSGTHGSGLIEGDVLTIETVFGQKIRWVPSEEI